MKLRQNEIMPAVVGWSGMNAIAKITRDTVVFAGASRNVVSCVFADRTQKLEAALSFS